MPVPRSRFSVPGGNGEAASASRAQSGSRRSGRRAGCAKARLALAKPRDGEARVAAPTMMFGRPRWSPSFHCCIDGMRSITADFSGASRVNWRRDFGPIQSSRREDGTPASYLEAFFPSRAHRTPTTAPLDNTSAADLRARVSAVDGQIQQQTWRPHPRRFQPSTPPITRVRRSWDA